MDTQVKRKVGAPFGNWNRLVHGNRSPRKRAERRAAWEAEQEEERKRFAIWSEPILDRCRQQHIKIIESLAREMQEQEAEEAQRVAHLKKVIH